MTDCVHINLRCTEWTVEQVMIKLSCMVKEHKKVAEENESKCADRFQNSEVWVMECTGELEFKPIEGQLIDPSALALLLQCKECSFFDFETVY